MIPAAQAVRVAMPSLAQDDEDARPAFSMLARIGPLDAALGAPARIMSPILQKLPLTDEDFVGTTPSAGEMEQLVEMPSLTRSLRHLVATGRYALGVQFVGSSVPLQHFLVQTLMRRGETLEAKSAVRALVRRWGDKSAWPGLGLADASGPDAVPDEALAASITAAAAATALAGGVMDAGDVAHGASGSTTAAGAVAEGTHAAAYWSQPLHFQGSSNTEGAPPAAASPASTTPTVLFVDSAASIARMVAAVDAGLAAAEGCAADAPAATSPPTRSALIPVGVDAEWRPDGWGPQQSEDSSGWAVSGKASWPVSIFQIALGSHILLIDCLALHALQGSDAAAAAGACLRRLFGHPSVVALGVGAADDLVRVAASLPSVFTPPPASGDQAKELRVLTCDLQAAAGLATGSGCSLSLSACVEAVLGLPLDKTAQVSDWQRRPLTRRQLVYAALDAAAPLAVLRARLGRPPYVGSAAEALLGSAVEVCLSQQARAGWAGASYAPAHAEGGGSGQEAGALPSPPAPVRFTPAPGVRVAALNAAEDEVLEVTDPGIPGGRGPAHVAAALKAAGIAPGAAFVHTPGSETVESSAAAVGCPPSAIVKSLAFWVGPLPVIVLAAGVAKVDTKRLRAAAAPLMASRGVPPGASTKVRFATAEECTTFFGFEPGTFPPAGHREEVVVLLDASVPAGVEAARAAAAAATAPATTGVASNAVSEDWELPPGIVFDADASVEDAQAAPVVAPQGPPVAAAAVAPATVPDESNDGAAPLWQPGILFAGGGRHDLSIRVTLSDLQALLQARAAAATSETHKHPMTVLVDVTKGGDAGAAGAATPLPSPSPSTPLAATSSEMGSGRPPVAGGDSPAAAAPLSPLNPRFIIDSMLGRLQRWLRVVGVDAAGSAGYEAAEFLAARAGLPASAAASLTALATPLDPDQLLAWANASGRILVTRDRKLYHRKDTCAMIFCVTNDTAAQFEFLSDHFGLMVRPDDLMSRCSRCNGLGYDYRTPDDIRAIMAADPGRQGPRPKVLDSVTDFWTCRRPQCMQIFWTGKKFQATRDDFAALFDADGRAAALTTFVPGRPQVPGGGQS